MIKFDEVYRALEGLRCEDAAAKMSDYMRGQFRFLGVAAPARKAACRGLLRSEKRVGVIDWEFLDRCWESEYRELQYVVLDYLAAMSNLLRFEDVARIERYIRSKQWWDTIDGLDTIVGNIAFVDKRIDGLMLKWSVDDDFWVRRIAIDHQLLRKERTDTALLEKILVNNFGSSEFFINKAIGWSLRDYSKTNPGWVRSFVDKYRGRMSSLSIREATKYVQ